MQYRSGKLVETNLFRFAALALLCVAAAGAQAQGIRPAASPTPPPAEQEVDPDDVISVNTTEILLPVTVRDRNGSLVANLERKDFRVFEDGVEQTLSDLSLRRVPGDVALIVDASSSVAGNLDDFRNAAEGFATHLANEDRISLIQFDDRVVML